MIHVDMDAFYASIEERDQPALRGKAVIVGGSPQGRGVVSSANYLARRFGVKSAMPAAQAKRLCSQAVFLPPRIDHYARIASQIRQIFLQYTPLVEPLSLDEAFLEIGDAEPRLQKEVDVGREIQRRIQSQLSLASSVGIGPNKFIAKIASDLKKPKGFVVVREEEVQAFLDPLPVERIWGVGPRTASRLRGLGLTTVRELRRFPREALKSRFGHAGEHYWRLAHGMDQRLVATHRQARSISAETTFESDLHHGEHLLGSLQSLAERVAERLRGQGLYAGTVTTKVRFASFRTVSRAQSLSQPSNDSSTLWATTKQLYTRCLAASNEPVRLLGVAAGKITTAEQRQLLLFDLHGQERRRTLHAAADEIRRKYGPDAMQSASSMRRGRNDRSYRDR